MNPSGAALGFSVHTGWAALVGVSLAGPRQIRLLDRRRVELIRDDRDGPRFVYHAAREASFPQAELQVRQASERSSRNGQQALRAAIEELRSAGYRVVASGIIGSTTPLAAPLAEILRSHSLVHTAEGVLFRGAIRAAVESLELPAVEISSKELVERAARRLGLPSSRVTELLTRVGREAGPPWSKDQKDACLAAVIALPS